MLNIGFTIRNPFSQRFDVWWTKTFWVSKHNAIAIGLYRTNAIIGGSFSITGLKQDHRGFSFEVDILGYSFNFQFYDDISRRI